MFAHTVGGLPVGKGERLWKGVCVGGLPFWEGWGDVSGEPYEIPPALRATSLFKGGSGERCSPLRWGGGWVWKSGEIVERGWWFNGWKGNGAMWASPPYEIPLSSAVTSPFSRGTRDSSALTGTSSGRGGSGEQCSPLR